MPPGHPGSSWRLPLRTACPSSWWIRVAERLPPFTLAGVGSQPASWSVACRCYTQVSGVARRTSMSIWGRPSAGRATRWARRSLKPLTSRCLRARHRSTFAVFLGSALPSLEFAQRPLRSPSIALRARIPNCSRTELAMVDVRRGTSGSVGDVSRITCGSVCALRSPSRDGEPTRLAVLPVRPGRDRSTLSQVSEATGSQM